MSNEERLEAFLWLPTNQWNVDNLVGPLISDSGYCKICDKYIKNSSLDQHISKHKKERDRFEKRKRKEAIEKRKESLRLAREIKKQNKLFEEEYSYDE